MLLDVELECASNCMSSAAHHRLLIIYGRANVSKVDCGYVEVFGGVLKLVVARIHAVGNGSSVR